MSNRPPDLIDKRLLKALEHPTRVLILSILSEGPSSQKRLVQRIGDLSRQTVEHHLQTLRELGCVEVIEEIPRGIGVERIYRGTKRQFFTDEEWAAFDPHNRTPVTASILRLVSEEAAESLESGKFDELPDNHLSRTPVEVDEQGWAETVALLARTLNELFEIHERSGQRAADAGDSLMTMRVVMMQFLLERDGDEPPGGRHLGPPPP